MIVQIITILLNLVNLIAQDYYDNTDVQFVQYFQVKLRELGDSSIVNPHQLTFSSKFDNPPKIITGIILYSNQNDFISTDFSVTGESISQEDCQITLHFKDKPDLLYSLTVSVLVIDTTQIPNMYVSDVIKLDINNPIKNGSYLFQEFTISYQLLNQVGNRDIALFLNGFSSKKQSNERIFNLLLQKEIGVNSFKIIVHTTSDSVKITSVYIQYIEYVESSSSNFFATIVDHEEFKDGNQKLASSSYGSTSTQNISWNLKQNKVYKFTPDSVTRVHFGINQLWLDNTINARIRMDKISLQNKILQFSYSVWDGSSSFGITSTSIFIGMKSCNDQSKYNFQNSCYNDCAQTDNQVQYYRNFQCQCKKKLYYYSDSLTTSNTQLPSSYCQAIQQSTCFICQKCTDINCQQCSQNQDTCNQCQPGYSKQGTKCIQCQKPCKVCGDASTCTQCEDNYYLFTNQCTLTQPQNTFCDANKVCMQCNLQGCSICNDPAINPEICLTCQPNFYKWQDKCQSDEPPNSYCNDKKECKSCNSNNVLNCAKCTDPDVTSTFKCLSCQTNFYSFNSQCQDKQPPNTFCDAKKVCVQCLQGCSICNDPAINPQICLTCQSNWYKWQDKCQSDEPPNSYCNDKKECKSCNSNNVLNCAKCTDPDVTSTFKCLSCEENYFLYKDKCSNQQPENTYCDQTQKCEECSSKGCKICKVDKIQCKECFESFKLEKDLCVCKESGQFYDSTSKKCDKKCESPCVECFESGSVCTKCGKGGEVNNNKTCVCTDQNQIIDDAKNCVSCQSDQNLVIKDNKQQCECKLEGYYISQPSKKCTQCTIKFCSQCNHNGDTCSQCQEGFKHNKLLGPYKQCAYCNEGIYADSNGECNQNLKCKEGCIRCSNSTDCELYKNNYVLKKDECHYSCSECYSKDQFDCLKCSSQSRVYDSVNTSCPCQPEYKENAASPNDTECYFQKSINYSSSEKQTRENMLNAVYILFIPQMFINIHPFGDVFLFSLQLLGNTSLMSKEEQPLQQFCIFNYINILYTNYSQTKSTIQNQQTQQNHQNENSQYNNINAQINQSQQDQASDEQQQIQEQPNQKQQKVLFLTYNTGIDEDIMNNLGVVMILYYLGIMLTGIVFIMRIFFQMYSSRFQRFFYWNVQLKVIRVSSNYLLLNAIVHYNNISSRSVISNIVIATLLFIYAGNFILCIHKSSKVDLSYFSFIYSNLNSSNFFHRYFWVLQEIQKVILAILIGLLHSRFHYYIIIIVSFSQILLLIKQKPGILLIRDCLYLIFNQLFLISISSVQIIAQHQYESNSISTLDSYRVMIDILAFLFGLFQYVYCIEYLLRKWWQNRKGDNSISSSKSSQVPIFLQMPQTINASILQDILNNTSSHSIAKFDKNSFSHKYKKY